MCLSLFQSGSANNAAGPPGGPARGGNWDRGSEAGILAVDATVDLTTSYFSYGFRCAR
jgi:hypothetical protein